MLFRSGKLGEAGGVEKGVEGGESCPKADSGWGVSRGSVAVVVVAGADAVAPPDNEAGADGDGPGSDIVTGLNFLKN